MERSWDLLQELLLREAKVDKGINLSSALKKFCAILRKIVFLSPYLFMFLEL